MKATWLRRPGTASIFTPKAGIVQECRTSSEVTTTRAGTSIGTTIRWSVSSSRKCPGGKSCEGTMYESKARSS